MVVELGVNNYAVSITIINIQNNVSCINIDSIALQHFTKKVARNVLLQQHLQEQ